MGSPEIRYTRSGEVALAYQVIGGGPVDLVFVPGWISNIEMAWELPEFARFLSRLASFARLIWFDKRGTGLSDRVAGPVTLEARSDDIRAVMDAAGSDRAVLGHGTSTRSPTPEATPGGLRAGRQGVSAPGNSGWAREANLPGPAVTGLRSSASLLAALVRMRATLLLSLASVMGPGCCHEEGTTLGHE